MTQILLWVALGAALLLCVAGIGLRWVLVVVTVRGASMDPTLHNGDRILVRRTRLNRIRQGQIVVFRLPERARGQAGADPDRPAGEPVRSGRSLDDRFMVKRAVAVPGGRVPGGLHPALAGQSGSRVPAECLVVVGDNAAESFDSRNFGFVTPDLVLGVVLRAMRSPVSRA
jgi:signal peptidase I